MWTFQENFRKDFDWHITPRLVVMELVKKRIQLQHIKLFLNKVQGKSQKCWALSLTPEGVRLKRLHEGIAGERGSISSFWTGNLAKSYPDNRGFTWQTKNGEKRKTSQGIASKSGWACVIGCPGVWTGHAGQTGCVTALLSRYSRAWTVCLSAGKNGAHLIKMARDEKGLQPRCEVILRHAQHDFDTIYSEVFCSL